MQRLKKIT